MFNNLLNSFLRLIFAHPLLKHHIHKKRCNKLIFRINRTVQQQKKDPLSIPIIIISYNRLRDLKKLVDALIEKQHSHIVILDNQSTYPPLLHYYQQIKDKVDIRFMNQNYGHLAFWENKKLYNELSKGYYVITDPDIIPNENLPQNYMEQMMTILDKHKEISKVGFALRIDDLPDALKIKDTVIEWEKGFWEKELGKDMYLADIDTTFALYYPRFKHGRHRFLKGIRMAGNFAARHGGWYITEDNLDEEDIFYFETANKSNTWKLSGDGNLAADSDIISQMANGGSPEK